MVGWHHLLNGHGLEETLGDCEGQGSLECCSSSSCRVRHNLATEQQQHKYTALALSLFSFMPWRRKWHPLQRSCLENPRDGGAWQAAVHGVAKSRTRLNDFSFTFPFHALEKEMAIHSSVLAWRIPGMGEPGGLPSTGSHRVGHD